MSRCLPYPPPGFQLKNGVHNLDLIESIKREREKTKKERKEKKRENKLKKEKSREDGEIKKKGRSHEKKRKLDNKAGDILKRREDEIEQLEKSCLTEDNGQPTNTQNLYDSSDSTQNSNKRKKHTSPSDSSRTLGSTILIRLPLQKHKSPVLPTSKEQVCSISVRTEIVANQKDEISSRNCKEQSCSTSGRNEIQAQDMTAVGPVTCLSKSGSRGVNLQFRELIENWVPPTMQIERMDFDDQDWLFERKPQQGHEEKRFKPSESNLCLGSAGWPRACYLPAVDIYALPYTVPF